MGSVAVVPGDLDVVTAVHDELIATCGVGEPSTEVFLHRESKQVSERYAISGGGGDSGTDPWFPVLLGWLLVCFVQIFEFVDVGEGDDAEGVTLVELQVVHGALKSLSFGWVVEGHEHETFRLLVCFCGHFERAPRD